MVGGFMTQESIRINSELVSKLRDYQQATGVPISRCIEEAVTTWLTCIAPTRIEAMNRPVFAGGVSGIVGHPHVTQEDVTAQGVERMKNARVKK
jgi:Ribbon-helix-helix domain